MKKVIGMLAVVALMSSVASAELLKNFKYDGKIEVNAYQVNNADYNKNAADKKNDVDTRVQINAGFDLNDDVNAVVSAIKCNRQYNAAGETVAAGTIDSFTFQQAYLNLKGVLGFDHKLGRQYYGNEGDLIVYYGPKNWPLTYAAAANGLAVTGLDGWTGWYKTGKWDTHAILAKAVNTVTAANTDRDIFGVVAKYDLGNEKLNPTAYYYRYNMQAGAIAGPSDNLGVIGAKANGKYESFDYNAEFAMNTGSNNNLVIARVNTNAGVNKYQGYGFLGNVKYGTDLAGKLNLVGEYAMGSGDKKADNKVKEFYAINSDYRPGIIYGGYQANAGITNLTTYNVGANWTPEKLNKLNLCLKYYNFAETEKIGTTKKIGTETDLVATWTHSDNVSLKLALAQFAPDKDLAPVNDDAEIYIGTSFNVKF